MAKSTVQFAARDTLVYVRVVLKKHGEPDSQRPDHICVRDHSQNALRLLTRQKKTGA